MQFADLTFSKSKETDLGVPQSLVDGGYVFLITTEAIQGLSNHAIKPAKLSFFKKCSHARSISDAAATDGVI